MFGQLRNVELRARRLTRHVVAGDGVQHVLSTLSVSSALARLIFGRNMDEGYAKGICSYHSHTAVLILSQIV